MALFLAACTKDQAVSKEPPKEAPKQEALKEETAREHGGESAGEKTDGEKDERAQVTEIKPLEVTVDQKPGATWSFEQLTHLGGKKPEDLNKASWSLRDAAKELVGPKARVVAVKNAEDERMEISKAEWLDEKKTPMMRANRQGQYKVSWTGANPMEAAATELRNVRSIEIVTD
jgi:hypothetical protein